MLWSSWQCGLLRWEKILHLKQFEIQNQGKLMAVSWVWEVLLSHIFFGIGDSLLARNNHGAHVFKAALIRWISWEGESDVLCRKISLVSCL